MANPLLQWWHSLSVEKQCAIAELAGTTMDDLCRTVTQLERAGLTREEAEGRAIEHMMEEADRTRRAG